MAISSMAGEMVILVGISILSNPSIRKTSSTISAGKLISGLLYGTAILSSSMPSLRTSKPKLVKILLTASG